MTDPTIDNPTETELKEGINQYILWQLVALKRRHFKASSSTSLVDKLIEAKAEMMSAVIMSRVAQAKEAWTREAQQKFLTLGMQFGASAGSAIGVTVKNDFGEEFDFQLDREAVKDLLDFLRSLPPNQERIN